MGGLKLYLGSLTVLSRGIWRVFCEFEVPRLRRRGWTLSAAIAIATLGGTLEGSDRDLAKLPGSSLQFWEALVGVDHFDGLWFCGYEGKTNHMI